jgi:hypothetical protein
LLRKLMGFWVWASYQGLHDARLELKAQWRYPLIHGYSG